MWDSIQPTEEWLLQQLPALLQVRGTAVGSAACVGRSGVQTTPCWAHEVLLVAGPTV